MSSASSSVAITVDPDFVSSPVPPDRRQSAWSVFAVFLGFIVVAGQMSVGGGLASQLSREDFLFAVLLGNAIAGVFAAFAAYTGARSGKSFAILTREAFPGATGRVAMLYVPIVLIGWYAIEVGIFASIVTTAAGANQTFNTAFILGSAALFASSTYLGFRGLRYVSYVAVPAMLALGTYAIVRVMTNPNAQYGFGPERIEVSHATALVVGSWIMGALTCVPDLTRFSRSARTAVLVGFVGIFAGNSFNHLVGGAGAAFVRQYDPALILLGVGLIIPGLVFALANIWTTNDGNMYSASLNAGPVFGISRRGAVVLCTGVAAAIALFQPHEVPKLFAFLGLLNVTAPSLGAVVIGGYWLRRRWSAAVMSPVPAWVAWVVGTGLAYLTGPEWAFAVGFLGSLAIYWGTSHALAYATRPALGVR